MARNDFTSDALTEGTEWTFVHSAGDRTLDREGLSDAA